MPVSDPSEWVPPDEMDDYVLLKLLGRGAMGQVYLAQDTLLDRQVAIKFIGGGTPDIATRQRFLIEARAAARISHPNVVAIYRIGELGERPYLVTEFVRGELLEALPKPVASAQVVAIGIALARGLAAAHRKGVLHCDIKPANVILPEEGGAKLLDFGLATLLQPREDSAPHRTDDEGEGTGLVAGTPDYLPPEIWRAQPATRRSDVYSLGALLFELAAGNPPFSEVAVEELPRQVQTVDAPPLGGSVDPRLGAIVARCLRRDPAERFASGDELREVLEQLERSGATGPAPEGNPYRGLRAFEAEQRGVFFGRTAEIRLLLDRLRGESFVLVAGDSGVGKSSLCRAGVLPAVEEGALGDGRAWSAATLTPGRHPVAALAAALAPHTRRSVEELASSLAEPTGFAQVLRELDPERGLVVFIDQLEELVTIADRAEAEQIEAALGGLAAAPRNVRVLATMRADFLTRFAGVPSLGSDLLRILYLVPPLSAERLREVVVSPAAATATRFETDGLVDMLVGAAAGVEGSLPLLQFALAELWEARDREHGVITVAALEAMGGVAGALARHADSVIAALAAPARGAARRMLIRLVTLEGTRARRTEQELTAGDPVARAALEALTRGRLLTAHDGADGTGYQLAHEVLLEGWGALTVWLREELDGRAARERLAQATAEWVRLARAGEALWSARQLGEIRAIDPATLGSEERSFVACSRKAVARRRWIRVGVAAGVPLVVAAVVLGVRLVARRDLDRRVQVELNQGRTLLASARARAADAEVRRRAAWGRFDQRDRAGGETEWVRALEQASGVERGYGEAGRHFEAALAKDPRRDEARALLTEVLLERALAADRIHDAVRRDELVERLSVYDQDGSAQRRFDQPATLKVAAPAGGRMTVARYEEHDGRLVLAPPMPLAGEQTLPRGSYLVRVVATGRAEAVLPVVLARGERLEVSLAPPPAGDVPRGMAWIPPGRFLFGTSADEESRRGFFDTVPLHPRSTGAFLIARREVTYGAWIEFLSSLPPTERARRAPSVPGTFARGALHLDPLDGGRWSLEIHPADTNYRATSGELLRYPGRARRASVDWQNAPVTGISAEDAQAYLAWLDRSGRVPGARMCSELEWERAGRGADDREYPSGALLDPDDANVDASYGRGGMGPDEVGAHPTSRSPFGLDDMSGNAFEWTRASLGDGEWVTRGGSYFHDLKTSRLVNRTVTVPALRDATLGMRVCADVRPSQTASRSPAR